MRNGRWIAALAMVAALGLGTAADAIAQQPVLPAEERIEVTEELLERFVEVYPAVVNVAQAAQAQLSAVETAEQAQAIQAEAQQRITATLEAGEITVAEYEAVVARLNDDEALRDEFQRLLEESLRGDGDGDG